MSCVSAEEVFAVVGCGAWLPLMAMLASIYLVRVSACRANESSIRLQSPDTVVSKTYRWKDGDRVLGLQVQWHVRGERNIASVQTCK